MPDQVQQQAQQQAQTATSADIKIDTSQVANSLNGLLKNVPQRTFGVAKIAANAARRVMRQEAPWEDGENAPARNSLDAKALAYNTGKYKGRYGVRLGGGVKNKKGVDYFRYLEFKNFPHAGKLSIVYPTRKAISNQLGDVLASRVLGGNKTFDEAQMAADIKGVGKSGGTTK